MDGSSRDTTTANNKNNSNGSGSTSSCSSKSLSRMSFPGHSKSNGTSNKKTTGNLKDQSTVRPINVRFLRLFLNAID